MSDYGVRYQIAYYRKSGNRTSIDILEKDYSSSISNLLACADPLVINEEGNINNIYKPSLGTGATIKILATPLSLQHLFTTDPQKYKVNIYDGEPEESSGADNLMWQGFINTGVYTESYSTPISLKSEITIECNDGMASLEDIPYTQYIAGINYTGFSTIGTVLQNIFSKLSLDFLTLRTITDLEYDSHTNLFTTLSVNNNNYYDEKNEAMSCREVLDCVIGGIGLVMKLRGFCIYVIDPIHLHLSSGASKEYDTHPTFGSNESVIGLGGYLDISAKEIVWDDNSQRSDIVQQFNYIDIKYDPYNYQGGTYNFSDLDNVIPGISSADFTNNGIDYRIYYEATMDGWSYSGVGYKFQGIQQTDLDELDDPEYYIRQDLITGAGTFTYDFPLSNIKQDDAVLLELSMDMYVNTKHQTNTIDPAELGTLINTIYVGDVEIKCGDMWFNGYKWYNYQIKIKMYVREADSTVIPVYKHKTWFTKRKFLYNEYSSEVNDKWINSFLYIPISEDAGSAVNLINGSIRILISNVVNYGDVIPEITDGHYTENLIQNVLIKNISLRVLDTNKTELGNNGILINGKIDSALTMKKSILNIDLKNGTGLYGVSKGAFSSDDAPVAGLNILGLSRGDSVEYKTSELLLQSLLGQYGGQRFKLTGCLNVKDYLTDLFLYLIKDTTYMGTIAFYIVSSVYHDREENMEVTMIELTDTREDIT